MENSLNENMQNDTEAVRRLPTMLSPEEMTEIGLLKEHITKLEDTVRRKDEFISEIGESKDEEAHEFDAKKAELLGDIEQLNAKLTKLTSELESAHADMLTERSLRKKLEEELRETMEKLWAERNRSINFMNSTKTMGPPADSANRSVDNANSVGESAEKALQLCADEKKALQSKLVETEENLRRCEGDNIVLHEKLEQMDNTYEDTLRELENLRDAAYNAEAELSRVKEEKGELARELAARSNQQESFAKPNVSLQEELNELNVNFFDTDDYSRLTQEAADWKRKYEDLVDKHSTKEMTSAQNPVNEPRQSSVVTHRFMAVDLITSSSLLAVRRPSQNSIVRIVSTGFWLSVLLVVFVMLRFAFCVFCGSDGAPCTLFGSAPPLRRVYVGIDKAE